MKVAVGEERACFPPFEVNSVEKVSHLLQLLLSSIFFVVVSAVLKKKDLIFRPSVYLQSVGIVAEVEFILYLQQGLWTAGRAETITTATTRLYLDRVKTRITQSNKRSSKIKKDIQFLLAVTAMLFPDFHRLS